MKRLTYLDGLKGWCAISVCIFHFLFVILRSNRKGKKIIEALMAKEILTNNIIVMDQVQLLEAIKKQIELRFGGK